MAVLFLFPHFFITYSSLVFLFECDEGTRWLLRDTQVMAAKETSRVEIFYSRIDHVPMHERVEPGKKGVNTPSHVG